MKPTGTLYHVVFVACLTVAAVLVVAPIAEAQSPFSGPIIPPECRLSAAGGNLGSCTLCHLGIVIINLTNLFMFMVALPSTALLVAIGGIMVLVAGPSQTRLQLGKKILWATIIGFLIVMLSWLAVDTIIKVLTGNASTDRFIGSIGPWNRINPASCPL